MPLHEIDIPQLANTLLPNCIRKPKLAALIRTMVAPLVTVNTNRLQFRNKQLQELHYTPQVFAIENMLNAELSEDERQSVAFYLTDSVDNVQGEDVVVYSESDTINVSPVCRSENQPNADHVIVWQQGQTVTGREFEIHVPASVWDNADLMNRTVALVAKFKLPTTIPNYTKIN